MIALVVVVSYEALHSRYKLFQAVVDKDVDLSLGCAMVPLQLAVGLGMEKWLRKSEQGDKWNRCLIEGMIVLSETGARDEQTTPP